MKPGQRIHFVGIGGIGMSGIARVMLQLGYQVSGSDLKASAITRNLQELGASIYLGHQASNIKDVDTVVLSTAINESNPEVKEALDRGLQIFIRSQMLGFLMRTRYGIAIAGTHGKTTTSSMVAHLLEYCQLRPTSVIGGEVYGLGSNAQLGAGPHLVAEADESDASFLELEPKIAVITNIDSDVNLSAPHFAGHNFDYDKTMAMIETMFVDFMKRVPLDGKLVLCADAPLVMEQRAKVSTPVVTYGLNPEADITAVDLQLKGFACQCTVVIHGRRAGQMRLHIPGKHNIQNALAAVAIGLELGLSFEQISAGLGAFQGVKRRFQILGTQGGVTVVDDYAHNPAKVMAALHAARCCAQGRVIGVFQPHRYTRTKFLAHEFAEAFDDADLLLMTDIYSAGEVPIVGVKTEMLIEKVRQGSSKARVVHTPGQKEVIDYLRREARPGDVVMLLGAGDVGSWGPALLDFLTQPVQRRAAAL
ncbi:UDP-N-acetylmuramate--L-alanine ligase [bacterium]|nr:UDP-N-acetylmuramate--L-alanine ligase [bacterium]